MGKRPAAPFPGYPPAGRLFLLAVEIGLVKPLLENGGQLIQQGVVIHFLELLLAILFLLLKNRRGPDDPDDTSEP